MIRKPKALQKLCDEMTKNFNNYELFALGDAILQELIKRSYLAQKEVEDRLKEPRYMTTEQVAEYLQVTRNWVYTHAFELGGKKMGSGWVFRKDLVDKYYERRSN